MKVTSVISFTQSAVFGEEPQQQYRIGINDTLPSLADNGIDGALAGIIESIKDESLRTRFAALVPHVINRFGKIRTVNFLMYLYHNSFFTAPASTRWHLSYEGGLLEHSVNVAEAMIDLSANVDGVSADTCAIIGLFHDVCKMDAYVCDERTGKFKWNRNRRPDVHDSSEHGELSVKRVSAFLPLSDAEKAAIEWHMGLYDWRLNPPRNAGDMTSADILDNIKTMHKRYEDTCNQYPTVKLAHIADMIASQLVEKD